MLSATTTSGSTGVALSHFSNADPDDMYHSPDSLALASASTASAADEPVRPTSSEVEYPALGTAMDALQPLPKTVNLRLGLQSEPKISILVS